MKQKLYLCIAFFTMLFASCADQDVNENSLSEVEAPGIKVSMSMEGNMQGDNVTAAAPAGSTRAIGYETRDDNGATIPVGIFDKGLNDGKELENGTKVDVLLIFRSTDETQPITKVVTKWTYEKGGKLTLMPGDTFEMKAGTDLSKGTWFVCGILGGEMLVGSNQVKFNGYSEGHRARNNAGDKITWGAHIPYVFSWRQLQTNQTNKTIKAQQAVRFKQFGTIVRLKVTNNTNFDFKYNGVRLITSNILCGQFDLKAFEDKDLLPTSELKDTPDSDIASSKSNTYKQAFKAFKFYQRPLTDNAMTGGADPNNGLIKKRRFRVHGNFIANFAEEKAKTKLNTALYYYDHTFLKDADGNNFDNVRSGNEASSYIYFWMYPQAQDVPIYTGNKQGSGDSIVKKVMKTQFMLMAVPDGNASAGAVTPKSINMIPAYGTLATYHSGSNYPARGSVVYKFAPLSYLAKHDNFGTDAQLSNAGNQDNANTIRYSFSEVEAKISTIPAGYMLANHEHWRTIIPQGYGFSGFRKKGDGSPFYDFSMGIVSPAKMPDWNDTKLVFHSYSKAYKENGKTYAYMIGMSKKPDYITNDGEGQAYQGYAKQSFGRVSSGITTPLNWIQNNDYRYVIRWEDVNNTAVLTQRYLGPRFVLDMDDIANEDFWADPSNGTAYPADVQRTIPLGGGYIFSKGNFGVNEANYWYRVSENWSAQYWTTDNALTGGRYATAPVADSQGEPAKFVVGFRMSALSADVGSFFYVGYKNTPLNQNQILTNLQGPSTYDRNLIMKIPVRLWRSTLPYED
jgi:hypothetical protein